MPARDRIEDSKDDIADGCRMSEDDLLPFLTEMNQLRRTSPTEASEQSDASYERASSSPPPDLPKPASRPRRPTRDFTRRPSTSKPDILDEAFTDVPYARESYNRHSTLHSAEAKTPPAEATAIVPFKDTSIQTFPNTEVTCCASCSIS
eukprot:NODE_8627_length_691_cov_26.274648_g8369_i0.p1 GENE.NODE_8627_length_691_cov_26.274648_g8369_i0~~NODE_8627_length_691_cov_26.274648_g8369_i0.p1  ORF type:complete len:149 (-),score=16.03 NODE_8627_length_691_cov_26.274648_g8369_i0:173-619(-)